MANSEQQGSSQEKVARVTSLLRELAELQQRQADIAQQQAVLDELDTLRSAFTQQQAQQFAEAQMAIQRGKSTTESKSNTPSEVPPLKLSVAVDQLQLELDQFQGDTLPTERQQRILELVLAVQVSAKSEVGLVALKRQAQELLNTVQELLRNTITNTIVFNLETAATNVKRGVDVPINRAYLGRYIREINTMMAAAALVFPQLQISPDAMNRYERVLQEYGFDRNNIDLEKLQQLENESPIQDTYRAIELLNDVEVWLQTFRNRDIYSQNLQEIDALLAQLTALTPEQRRTQEARYQQLLNQVTERFRTHFVAEIATAIDNLETLVDQYLRNVHPDTARGAALRTIQEIEAEIAQARAHVPGFEVPQDTLELYHELLQSLDLDPNNLRFEDQSVPERLTLSADLRQACETVQTLLDAIDTNQPAVTQVYAWERAAQAGAPVTQFIATHDRTQLNNEEQLLIRNFENRLTFERDRIIARLQTRIVALATELRDNPQNQRALNEVDVLEGLITTQDILNGFNFRPNEATQGALDEINAQREQAGRLTHQLNTARTILHYLENQIEANNSRFNPLQPITIEVQGATGGREHWQATNFENALDQIEHDLENLPQAFEVTEVQQLRTLVAELRQALQTRREQAPQPEMLERRLQELANLITIIEEELRQPAADDEVVVRQIRWEGRDAQFTVDAIVTLVDRALTELAGQNLETRHQDQVARLRQSYESARNIGQTRTQTSTSETVVPPSSPPPPESRDPRRERSRDQEPEMEEFLRRLLDIRNTINTIDPRQQNWTYEFTITVGGQLVRTERRVDALTYIDRMRVQFRTQLQFAHEELISEVITLINQRIEDLNNTQFENWRNVELPRVAWIGEVREIIGYDLATLANYRDQQNLHQRVTVALNNWDANIRVLPAGLAPTTPQQQEYLRQLRRDLELRGADIENMQQALWEADVANMPWMQEAIRLAALDVATLTETDVRTMLTQAERALQTYNQEAQALNRPRPLTNVQHDYITNHRAALERAIGALRLRRDAVDNTPDKVNQRQVTTSIEFFMSKRGIPVRAERPEFADAHEYLKVLGTYLYDIAAVTMLNELLDDSDEPRTVSYIKGPMVGPAKEVSLLGQTLIYDRETTISVYNFESFLDQLPMYFTDHHERHLAQEFMERFKKQFKEISVWHNRGHIRRHNEDPSGPSGAYKALSHLQAESKLAPDMKDLFNVTHESTEVERQFNEAIQFSMGLWSVMSLKQYERIRLWDTVDPTIKKYFDVKTQVNPNTQVTTVIEIKVKQKYDLIPRYRSSDVDRRQMVEDMLADMMALGLSKKQALLAYHVGETYRIGAGLEAFMDAEYKPSKKPDKKGGVSVKAVEGEPKAANIGLYVTSARGNEVRPEFNTVFSDYLVHGYVPFSRAAQYTCNHPTVQISEYSDGRASLAEILSVKGAVDYVDWSTRSTDPDKIIQAGAMQAVNFLWPSASIKESITPKHSFFIDVNDIPLQKNALASREDELTPLRNYFLNTTWIEKFGARLVLGFTKPRISVYETFSFRSDSEPISGSRDAHLRSLYKDSRDYWLNAFSVDANQYPFDFVRTMRYMFSRDDMPDGFVNSKVALAFRHADQIITANKLTATMSDNERAEALKKQKDWVKESFTPWMTAYLTYDVLMRSVFALLAPNAKGIKELQNVELDSNEGKSRIERIYRRLEFRIMDSYLIKTIAGTNILNSAQVNFLINQANLLQQQFPGETEKFSRAGYKLFYNGEARNIDGVLFTHADLLKLAQEFNLGEGYQFKLQEGAKGEYFLQLQRINGHQPTFQYFADRLVILMYMFARDKIKVTGGK